MSAPARLVAFGVALVVALGAGAAIGAAVGPLDSPNSSHGDHEEEAMSTATDDATHTAHHDSASMADPAPGRYRLFSDFSVDDVVRTASFTVDVAMPSDQNASTGHTHAPGEEHP